MAGEAESFGGFVAESEVISNDIHVLEVLRAAMIQDMGRRTQKEVALELDLDPALLSRYLAPGSSLTLPSRLVPRWTNRVGPNYILALADLCALQVRRKTGGADAALVPLVSRVASEAGSTLATCLDAMADGQIDAGERAAIHAETGRLLVDVQAVHDATAAAEFMA